MRIVVAATASEEGRGRQASRVDKYEVVLYALPEVMDLATQLEQSPEDYINANTWMVKNGLARVSTSAARMINRKSSRRGSFAVALLQALHDAQEAAHREHLRMYVSAAVLSV